MTSIQVRLWGVDYFRTIAIIAVICLHTSPFQYSATYYNNDLFTYFALIIRITSRFAVPYFFIAAGFFFGKALMSEDLASVYARYLKRLSRLFICWTMIYSIFPEHTREAIQQFGVIDGIIQSYYNFGTRIINHPFMFLMEGSSVPLWFLPALIINLSILVICLRVFKKVWQVGLFGLSCYIFGVLSGAYFKTQIGLPLSFNVRFGPFFGLIFVVFGYMLSRKDLKCGVTKAVVFVIIFYILQIIEGVILYHNYGINKFEYSFSTVLFSCSIFILALNLSWFQEKRMGGYFIGIAPFTLGIYLAHDLIRRFFSLFLGRISPFLWDLFIVPAVLFSTIFLVKRLINNRVLQLLVK